jgi:hypothetical protein
MDPVGGADAAAVAVAGHHEDVEVGSPHLDPFGDRQRPAVQAMKTIGVHVVGKAARAADSRNEDRLFRRQLFVATEALHGGEDCVVAAAGAPAWLDIALIVLDVVTFRGHS